MNASPIARRLWTLLWDRRASASVLAVVAGLAALVLVSAAPATTTSPFTTIYSYDRVAPNAQVALASISAASGRVATPTWSDPARRSANAGRGYFVAAKAGDDVVYHYTDDVGRGAIEKSGQIRNPNPGGENFFTPSKFCSGAQARECLALGRTPTGYFEIPRSRLPASTRGPFAVQGPRGPTGAYEYITPDPVDVAGLPFRPFPGVAP